jgi:hypothetical protein
MPDDDAVLRIQVSSGKTSFSAEGREEVVLRLYEEFRSARDATSESAGAGEPEQGGAGGKLPLPKFLETYPPRTNPEAVAALAAWAHDHDGKNEVTTKEIAAMWRRTPRKKPGNLGRDIAKAVNNGWLEDAGYGRYAIPEYGLNFVKSLKQKGT